MPTTGTKKYNRIIKYTPLKIYRTVPYMHTQYTHTHKHNGEWKTNCRMIASVLRAARRKKIYIMHEYFLPNQGLMTISLSRIYPNPPGKSSGEETLICFLKRNHQVMTSYCHLPKHVVTPTV